MLVPESEKLSSLSIDPFSLESIPQVPQYDFIYAKGGEDTFDVIGDGKTSKITPIIRPAEPGEILRDNQLRTRVDFSRNLMFRIERRILLEERPDLQELELEYCKSSIVYFFNTWLYTLDPRNAQGRKQSPFITYPFQEEILRWWIWSMKMGVSTIVEKSRDMGLSWLLVGFDVWLALFHKDVTTYQFSMTEDDVDNRTVKSLFGKTRYLLRNLPEWMKAGWREEQTGIDMKMKLIFPKNNSEILGQLTGGTIARGGRCSRASLDEFAHVDNSDEVLESVSELTGNVCFFSSVNGMGNAFAEIAHDPANHKMTIHWSLHPLKDDRWAFYRKNQPYYRKDESVWAQEQEICYEKSTKGRVYYDFVSFTGSDYEWSHIQSDEYFRYDDSFDVYVGIDLGVDDALSIVFAQYRPAHLDFVQFTDKCFIIFDEKEETNWGVDDASKFLLEQKEKYNFVYKDIVIDARTGNQRDAKKKTWAEYFRENGIPVVMKRNPTEMGPIEEVHQLLSVPGKFCVTNTCTHTIKSFQNWKWPVDPRTGVVPQNAKPKHDKWSHNMKAVCYLADYVFGGPVQRTKKSRQWGFYNVKRITGT